MIFQNRRIFKTLFEQTISRALAIMMSDVEDFHTNTLSVGKIPGLIILMLAIADLSFWTTQG